MDIKNYITFNAVAENEGFTKAAIKLNYAQSTVTQHIKELELHYNERLFDRIGKKIKLTTFGESVYLKSKELIIEYNQVLALNNQQTKEVLRIGGYESLFKYRMYNLIKEFKMLYPNVNIILHEGICRDLRKKVLDGELDLTFQVEHDDEFNNLNSLRLCEEKFSLILPKNKTIEYMHEPNKTIYLTEPSCSYRVLFENYLFNNKISTDLLMETSSVDMIKQYVSFGLGVSMVPDITVRNEQNKLTIVPMDNVPLYTQIVYHKDKHVFPAMKHFVDLVISHSKNWN